MEHLVIQLARFGDLLQMKRLVLSLEREGRVHIALDESLLPLARLVYPKAELHALKAHAGGVTQAEALSKNYAAFAGLAEIGFSSVYNLNRNPMNFVLSGMFEPGLLRGYTLELGQPVSTVWADMAGRWSFDRKISPLSLVDFWAFFHHAPIAAEQVNPVACPRRTHRIGVVLAGRESRRSLPPEYLARIMEAVFESRKGPSFVLMGGKSEQEAARRVCKYLKPSILQKVEDLSGQTSLTDLYELMQELDLVLTPDTGSMHLAAHLGVPVMAFFLSSAWVYETGPYGLGHLVWQSLKFCSPCLETAACPRKVVCLEPFHSPDWLAHLSGRNSGGWPEDMLGLVSSFDSIGATYLCVDGNSEPARPEARLQQRALLAEYLGLCGPGASLHHIPYSISEKLLQERDWMLPDPHGRRKVEMEV